MKSRPVALLDACVLVPMPLADTLLRLAEPPALFDARWSEDILAEMSRALVRKFAKAPAKAGYREAAMRRFFPQALVEGYRPLIGEMRNHPKDRHVLAAALACQADYLVTFNLRDFPAVAGDSTEVVGPSAFLKDLWKLDRSLIVDRLQEQADAIGVPMDVLLHRLAQSVPAFVERVRKRA
ncbi:MAG: PIN domain-containing protein [Acidobacteria bacterium]|nr:PIN domain-containing protein [Acidobacteriota bacterium]